MAWKTTTPNEKLIILEPEDHTAEDWQSFLRLFGGNDKTEIIRVTLAELERYDREGI